MSYDIDFKKCKEQGKIKDLDIAKTWVQKEIIVAQNFLKSAQFNFKSKHYDMTIIAGYLVIFHLNRALIYNMGKIIKNHICAILAVKELYKDNVEIIELLSGIDNALISRNQIQYDGYNADKEMADFILCLGKDYLAIVKKLVD